MQYTYINKLLPLIFLLFSNTANAAQTADLTVTGTIRPPSCNIAFLGSSNTNNPVNFGDLNQASSTTLPDSLPLTFRITCSGPTAVGLKFIDNAPGDVPTTVADTDVAYGLSSSSTNPIGSYTIKPTTTIVDTFTGSNVLESVDDGANWTRLTNGDSVFKKFDTASAIYGFSTSASTPINVTVVDITYQTVITIEALDTIDASAGLNFYGGATIELIYL